MKTKEGELGLSHWKGWTTALPQNAVWGHISQAPFLKKKPWIYLEQKSKCVCPDLTLFFKVSSANEIPQPWAVLGIQCWFLKYGDILLQILRQPRNDECSRVWEERNFQIQRSSDIISHAKQTARGSCFKEVFCYSFEIPLADQRRTLSSCKFADFNILGLERQQSKRTFFIFLGCRMKFGMETCPQGSSSPTSENSA